MPSLEQISEAAATDAEQCVRESMQMDYAFMADLASLEHNLPANRFYEWIDRKYARLIGGMDGGGNG